LMQPSWLVLPGASGAWHDRGRAAGGGCDYWPSRNLA
jgi:hypothetical protein